MSGYHFQGKSEPGCKLKKNARKNYQGFASATSKRVSEEKTILPLRLANATDYHFQGKSELVQTKKTRANEPLAANQKFTRYRVVFISFAKKMSVHPLPTAILCRTFEGCSIDYIKSHGPAGAKKSDTQTIGAFCACAQRTFAVARDSHSKNRSERDSGPVSLPEPTLRMSECGQVLGFLLLFFR